MAELKYYGEFKLAKLREYYTNETRNMVMCRLLGYVRIRIYLTRVANVAWGFPPWYTLVRRFNNGHR